jgi:antitoxin FitA
MAQVLIRNLDEEVVARLKARAKAKGRSLQQELREIVQQAAPAPMNAQERLAFVDRLRAMSKPNVTQMTLDDIREGLE